MSLFNELPFESITAINIYFKGSYINLDDLKDQLFKNPDMKASELLEQLERGRILEWQEDHL